MLLKAKENEWQTWDININGLFNRFKQRMCQNCLVFQVECICIPFGIYIKLQQNRFL